MGSGFSLRVCEALWVWDDKSSEVRTSMAGVSHSVVEGSHGIGCGYERFLEVVVFLCNEQNLTTHSHALVLDGSGSISV